MTPIAGSISLTAVLADLAGRRPVFHSEADLQFAFGQVLNRLNPDVQVRLEVPHRDPDGMARYVDLECWTATRRTLVEFKYFTRSQTWLAPDGEQFTLKGHAATDLARLGFIRDVHRLEHLTRDAPGIDGIALMLTNAPTLWENPGNRRTRDAAFRIHQGNTLTGQLAWGTTDRPHPGNDHTLRDTYTVDWHDYPNADTAPDAPRLRWLAFAVNPKVTRADSR